MFVGDIQDQVDCVVAELFNLKIFLSRMVTIRLQTIDSYRNIDYRNDFNEFKWSHSAVISHLPPLKRKREDRDSEVVQVQGEVVKVVLLKQAHLLSFSHDKLITCATIT